MKDRLIELIDGFDLQTIPNSSREWMEQFADHLIANGVIVPPVKVGQTVYDIDLLDFEPCKHSGENGDVCPYLYAEVGFGYECQKTRFGEKLKECSTIKEVVIKDIDEILSIWGWFGKTVFLTKEEAEKALAESEDKE